MTSVPARAHTATPAPEPDDHLDRTGGRCPTSRHDTVAAYIRGCRHPEATAAKRRYEIRRRADRLAGQDRVVDALGTRRRLQALSALGYSTNELAALLGVTQNVTWRVQAGVWQRIRSDTARRVDDLYEELSATPSRGDRADYVRSRAVAAGWGPPLAWDDIDDPAAEPDFGARVNRNLALHEDSEWLINTQGYTLRNAADRLGVSRSYLELARASASRQLAAQRDEATA